MRVPALLVTLAIPAAGLEIAACGQASPPAAPVHLQVRSPADGTNVPNASIMVSGTVSPARAQVVVLGHPTAVRPDGAFSARVSLSLGANVIDVLASLPHATEAMSAIHVKRSVPVVVPPVAPVSPVPQAPPAGGNPYAHSHGNGRGHGRGPDGAGPPGQGGDQGNGPPGQGGDQGNGD